MPSPASSASAAASWPSRSAIVGGKTMSGHHLLDIEGFSHTKELPVGECIKSTPFSVGSCSWRIHYYHNGSDSDGAEFISVFVNLDQDVSEPIKAPAEFNLLDPSGDPGPSHTRATALRDFAAGNSYGYSKFIKRSWLEESTCLKNDRFTIRCDILVSKKILRTEKRKVVSPMRDASSWTMVPPSDLHRQLGDLLVDKESTDVTFQVAGETFKARRCVLAARSPAFKAELFFFFLRKRGRALQRDEREHQRSDDMEAKVFSAFLGFVYTDMLQDVPGMKLQKEVVMAQHLLFSADRYNMERLKLICEDKLCRLMDTSSVATILTLSEQHNCQGLKKAWFQFLSAPSALIELTTGAKE